jgi:hypothetical protein
MSMTAVSRQVLALDRHSINAADTSRGGALELEGRSGTPIGRLTKIQQAIVSGAGTCCARCLAALQDSRRKRAAIEIARFPDLIHDSDTGISSGMKHLRSLRHDIPSRLLRIGAVLAAVLHRRTPEQDALRGQDCRRWCDSSERRINYEIMTGRRGDF